jgi:hypothetical protein
VTQTESGAFVFVFDRFSEPSGLEIKKFLER